MKIKYLSLAAAVAMTFGLYATPTFAADKINVLVIDSGSDFTHAALNPVANANKAEQKGQKGVDDDKNGYIDDVYGWNFVENNNTLVNLKDTPPQYDTVLKLMEYLGRLQAYGKESFSAEEWSWLVKNYNNPKLQAWVGFVGGWAHGTHCAGIIALKNDAVTMNAIRHIQTGTSPAEEAKEALSSIKHMMAHRSRRSAKVSMADLEQYFSQLGQQYAAQVKEKASYIASLNPRLINCSFGTENSGLLKMMKGNMEQWGFSNPTDEQVQEVVNLFVTKAFLPRDKALFSGCKDALIFIAAGNSSENLDGFVTSPNNVPMTNKIVVGATDEDQKIAAFSCYGVKTVDVAVPGVNIYATYPNQKMGYMSGTSMACPNALRYASMVLEANPNLKPVELKKILMSTVDKKEWLKDKVKTGGVINVTRAIEAAKAVKSGKTVAEACKLARKSVSDKVSRPAKRTRPDLKDPVVKKMYFSNVY